MKKLNTKYIVAIIISLIIGISIFSYGYFDYKYKTNRDLQKLETVITPTNIPTIKPTNTPIPTNIPILTSSPIPTHNPLIDIQIKYLENKIEENIERIDKLNAIYKIRLNSMNALAANIQAFNQNITDMNSLKSEIHVLESQNIELNRQKTELMLKK